MFAVVLLAGLIGCGGGSGSSSSLSVGPEQQQTNELASLTGRVLYNSQPLSGASVRLYKPETAHMAGSIMASVVQTNQDEYGYYTTSDSNGYYNFVDIPVGEYTLIAIKDSRHQFVRTNVMLGSVTRADAELTPTSSILGEVVILDEDDNEIDDAPLSGIVVYLEGTSYSAWTDSVGKFEIRHVPANESFTLTAANEMIKSTATQTVSLSKGTDKELDKPLKLYTWDYNKPRVLSYRIISKDTDMILQLELANYKDDIDFFIFKNGTDHPVTNIVPSVAMAPAFSIVDVDHSAAYTTVYISFTQAYETWKEDMNQSFAGFCRLELRSSEDDKHIYDAETIYLKIPWLHFSHLAWQLYDDDLAMVGNDVQRIIRINHDGDDILFYNDDYYYYYDSVVIEGGSPENGSPDDFFTLIFVSAEGEMREQTVTPSIVTCWSFTFDDSGSVSSYTVLLDESYPGVDEGLSVDVKIFDMKNELVLNESGITVQYDESDEEYFIVFEDSADPDYYTYPRRLYVTPQGQTRPTGVWLDSYL